MKLVPFLLNAQLSALEVVVCNSPQQQWAYLGVLSGCGAKPKKKKK
jgi:hypothetical protein